MPVLGGKCLTGWKAREVVQLALVLLGQHVRFQD